MQYWIKMTKRILNTGLFYMFLRKVYLGRFGSYYIVNSQSSLDRYSVVARFLIPIR